MQHPDKDLQRASLLASFNASQLRETKELLAQCKEEFKSIGSMNLSKLNSTAGGFGDSASFRNFSASFSRLIASPGGLPRSATGPIANKEEEDDNFDWDSIT